MQWNDTVWFLCTRSFFTCHRTKKKQRFMDIHVHNNEWCRSVALLEIVVMFGEKRKIKLYIIQFFVFFIFHIKYISPNWEKFANKSRCTFFSLRFSNRSSSTLQIDQFNSRTSGMMNIPLLTPNTTIYRKKKKTKSKNRELRNVDTTSNLCWYIFLSLSSKKIYRNIWMSDVDIHLPVRRMT